MRRALDWGGTVAFSLFFGATLLSFDVVLRLATPFGRRTVERVGVWLQTTLVTTYRAAGIRPTLERSPKIEPGRAYILLSNHQSMFDIPLFAWAMPESFPSTSRSDLSPPGFPGSRTTSGTGVTH